MKYLHGQSCFHRDLAARNILLDAQGKHAKIRDLGMAIFVKKCRLNPIPYSIDTVKNHILTKFSIKNYTYVNQIGIFRMQVNCPNITLRLNALCLKSFPVHRMYGVLA